MFYLHQWFPTEVEFLPREEWGISWVQGRNFHFIVKLPVDCKCCTFFKSWHWLFELVIHFGGLSHFLLTNFSAIIWQTVFVPLLLIKLLSSMKTIVPIVVNTNLPTRTREDWKFHRGGMHQKRLGTTDLYHSLQCKIQDFGKSIK